jgi:RNA polymerase sigma-70 factor (ECF subfamily)
MGFTASSWVAKSDFSGDVVPNDMCAPFVREEHGNLSQRTEIVDLYDKLRPSLYGYLICLGLMPQEADDVIQDTFFRLFRVLQSGGKVENLRSWLFRVAHNLSQNLQKRERRLISETAEDGYPSSFEKPDAGPNPEELYIRKEQLLLLDRAVSRLPRLQRECLHLRAEGLRYREIAEILSVSVSGVGEALKRAVIRLMSELYE